MERASPYPHRMFTGIVERTGVVGRVSPTEAGRELLVDAAGWGAGFAPGESISVNGVCLTLAPRGAPGAVPGVAPGTGTGTGGVLRFDVVPETLAKTTLGGLGPGARVNLERAATAATLMGGHVVQGHVEGVGEVRAVRTEGEWRVTIGAPKELMPCITPKGSIAVEGVSLTVASVDVAASSFDVALIPTTLEVTTLGGLRAGSRVNLETDIMARTIVHYLRNFTGR